MRGSRRNRAVTFGARVGFTGVHRRNVLHEPIAEAVVLQALVAGEVQRLADDDAVDLSNLQRQVLYSEPEIGLSKAEQAKLRLQALNSDIRVEAWNERLTPQNAECLIANYDIVVDGCDNFRTRYLINDTCVRLDKVYVYGAIREFDGQVSVFNYQGGPDYRTLFPDEEEMLAMPHPSKAVLGVTPGVVGCVETSETIKVILGSPYVLSGKLWHIDLRSLESYVISLV